MEVEPTGSFVSNVEGKEYFLKHGFKMLVVLSDPPHAKVLDEKGKTIYQAVLNTTIVRKKSNTWLSLNTILKDHLSGFAHSNMEADEIIEKKLTELWGNPAYSEIK